MILLAIIARSNIILCPPLRKLFDLSSLIVDLSFHGNGSVLKTSKGFFSCMRDCV